MKKWSKAARKMVPVIVIASLVFAAAGAAFFAFISKTDSVNAIAFASGVVLLGFFNVFKVYLIERAVRKAVTLTSPDEARNYIRLQSLMRLGLTAAALGVAALIFLTLDKRFDDSHKHLAFTFGESGVVGACAGVITFQIAAFSLRFMDIQEDEEEGDAP
ncbi:MAG: hypothetical protein FWG31_09270 [Oscillospiraceae bacterium]|nr:hypothetical protein [Oscillospiraceae bacterium]